MKKKTSKPKKQYIQNKKITFDKVYYSSKGVQTNFDDLGLNDLQKQIRLMSNVETHKRKEKQFNSTQQFQSDIEYVTQLICFDSSKAQENQQNTIQKCKSTTCKKRMIIQAPDQQIEKSQMQKCLKSKNNQNQCITYDQDLLCYDYSKNILAYITKKILGLILSPKNKLHLQKLCHKWQVDINEFISHHKFFFPKLYGPNSLIRLFKSTIFHTPIHELFIYIFTKCLRKQYTVLMIREGRMVDIKSYIEFKNKYLLYFSSLLQK